MTSMVERFCRSLADDGIPEYMRIALTKGIPELQVGPCALNRALRAAMREERAREQPSDQGIQSAGADQDRNEAAKVE
jgi:hypothetical protein